MTRARASVTLQESAEGEVYVSVQTGKPLAPEELSWDWLPARYRDKDRTPVGVGLRCTLDATSDLWLPELRASTPRWHVDRYVDITGESEERPLFERMLAQKDVEHIWPNEGLRGRLFVDERTRELIQETLAAFPELDRATWKEAVAESEWRESENWRPGPRPRKPKRRTAEPPAGVELRYFATRTGALPREGAARVADIKLPPGRRLGGFWCSDEVVDEALALASRLAEAFSATGLWPLLWAYPEEPTGYMSGLGDLEWVEGVEATTLLGREWAAHPPRPEWMEPLGTTFPGLATPIDRQVGVHFEPFDTLMAHRLKRREPISAQLLVVPCNRPADALTAVGFGGVQLRSEDLSAILRSWEERFGAYVTLLDPGRTVLCVEARPQTFAAALGVAAEHFAVAPQEDAGRPGALAEQARMLQGAPSWDLNWRG